LGLNSEFDLPGFPEAFPDAVIVVDREGLIRFVNRCAETMLDVDRHEVVGRSVEILIPESLRRSHCDSRAGFFSNPELRPMGEDRELALLRPDGQIRRVEIGLGPVEVDGEEFVVCCLRDVSPSKEREERLQEVVDSMPGLFYVFNNEGRLVWWNRAFGRVTGYTSEELDGRIWSDFIAPDDRDQVERLIGLLFEDGKTRVAEYNLILGDGSTAPYAGSGALCDFDGKPHMVGLTIDASHLRQTEAKLRERVAEVEELKNRLESENAYLRQEVVLTQRHGDIIGESKAIRKALEQVERVAGTESTVLLLGETGTGKELMARRVHDLSRRSGRPMITVNCAALPATLMESELFGREKGAFTGAVSRQAGRFEVADKSTLFLDEIGELPLELQSKLLRVLEEGEFERVGSSKTTRVDVRIIAATNIDLAQAAREGRFRQDLYYRLNVFPIEIPALRERPEDIPLLVWSFIEEIGREMGVTIENVSQGSMDRLQRRAWSGNVRELRNVVERSMIFSRDRTFILALPEVEAPGNGEDLTLDEVQRRHIRKILDVTGGKISGSGGAAEVLGLKPTTLRSRMERLGMDPRA
jgi:PAS domain S-box-containing protein